MSRRPATLEYRWALATAIATFLLLMAGGAVNVTGSSLACPEALVICKGSLFPHMSGGVLFEHGHRLIAMSVGLLQLALTVILWRRRHELRGVALFALILVVIQAGLGATTVHFKLPWFVSTAHLMVAESYFALTLYQAWRTRPRRLVTPADPQRPARASAAVQRWIAIGAVAIFLQILLGGLVRHFGAALASITLPLDHGRLWPVGGPLPLKLHMAHRIGGVLVGTIAIVCAIGIFRGARGAGGGRGGATLRKLALVVPVAILAQITLGAYVILTFRSVPVVMLHFGCAALIWGLFCAMWLISRGGLPAARTIDQDAHPARAGGSAGDPAALHPSRPSPSTAGEPSPLGHGAHG